MSAIVSRDETNNDCPTHGDAFITFGGKWMLCPSCAAAELAAKDAEIARLKAVLKPCVALLEGLVAESHRSIDWGEEDSFRMGEWFEKEDIAAIKEARVALVEAQ